MRKYRIFNVFLFFLFSVFIFYASSSAEDSQLPGKDAPDQVLSASDNVTLDFKDADILNVLRIISYKSGINIVTTPEVIGNVNIMLVDVPWQTALDTIVKTYNFGYEWLSNKVIMVSTLEKLSQQRKAREESLSQRIKAQEEELSHQVKVQETLAAQEKKVKEEALAEEPLQTEIFNLKFLDAQDAQKIIIPLLSPRGRISVLYARGQKGWNFGTFKIGRETATSAALEREKQAETKPETIAIEKNATGDVVSREAKFDSAVKSKVLLITDTAPSLDRIRNIILPTIDKKPKQVLIETRIMEVKKDRLKDIGVDWGTGVDGATATNPTDLKVGGGTLAARNIGGASTFSPNAFNPLEGVSTFPGTYPYKAGAEFIFKKIGGSKLEVILHALEEDANTNTLSAPRILTLDNQEASILVGYHTPILASTVTAGSAAAGTGATVTQTLDYYQEIGIRLNVVPQISEEGYINMIIHPSVTSSTSNVTATSTASGTTTSTNYPIIDVREAQTQVLIKDNETIVIGGLLKDVKTKERIGVPFLMDIPWLGKFFTRETNSVAKVDLLIFITARVLEDNELSKDELDRFNKGVDYMPIEKTGAKKKGWDSLLAP